eukprot:CAMPEP_0201131518 /NCGR_PEP_ID=MMETSP0850-20130426/42938_1 /ASSEMBLY_ACC=CAM_ASM_000622 /TAXON_ID=183588 /ORGANISM="Pseudo-nitzschia fraudulenta, Strain WWA7" /LENGTH=151 /DNA_ID=CAMNT_0047401569 /DNA_START=98 /DNA_END=553 /DNA_ORIENTATION=-
MTKTSRLPRTAAVLVFFVVASAVVGTTEAFLLSPSRGLAATQTHRGSRSSTDDAAVSLRSTRSENNSDDETENEATTVTNTAASAEDRSPLEKLNRFLDTPILDANNRSDQGAVAETLKEFVRDEPEIAQVTFSVVVVAMMVLVTRVVLSH